jgi:hypothetical protein
MTTRHRVECINKPDRYSPVEHITHIGGSAGSGWRMYTPQAIRRVQSGDLAFFVRVGDDQIDVTVSTSAHGNKYLKTISDHTKRDNLLSLPDCPATYPLVQ